MRKPEEFRLAPATVHGALQETCYAIYSRLGSLVHMRATEVILLKFGLVGEAE